MLENERNSLEKYIDIVSIKLVRKSSVLYFIRKINSPSDVVELIKNQFKELDREEFIVITLDNKNQLTSLNICAIGTLNQCMVHPREVFKTAILSNSSSILVAHNHLSGDFEPSSYDIDITKRLSESGDILGIKLLDHIIWTHNGYFSFKENHLI